MEKIKLLNDQSFDLVTGGIVASGDALNITVNPGEMDLVEIEAMFMLAENTQKIYVLDSFGDEIAVFNDFVNLRNVSKDVESQTVHIVLVKKDMASRLADLESIVDELILTLLEV